MIEHGYVIGGKDGLTYGVYIRASAIISIENIDTSNEYLVTLSNGEQYYIDQWGRDELLGVG